MTQRVTCILLLAALTVFITACAQSGIGILGYCGDGRLVDEIGEDCDDGNNIDGDGCTADCLIEIPPVCGDGNVDPGEDCDDGNMVSGDGCSDICEIEPPTLADVQAMVFTPTCTACHFVGGPAPFSLENELNSYNNLVNRPSFRPPWLRVEPFNSEDSYLVHKVEERPGIIGQRMPPPPVPPLSQAQIDLIRGWIDAGADP